MTTNRVPDHVKWDRYEVDWGRSTVVEKLPDGGRIAFLLRSRGMRVAVRRVSVTHPSGVDRKLMRYADPREVVRFFEFGLGLEVARQTMVDLVRKDQIPASFLQIAELLEHDREDWLHWEQLLEMWRKGPHFSSRYRLANTAALYVDACRRGAKAPNVEVAVSQARTARQVTEDLRAARAKGLLTKPPSQGQSDGNLTDEARRILKEEEDE